MKNCWSSIKIQSIWKQGYILSEDLFFDNVKDMVLLFPRALERGSVEDKPNHAVF